MTETIKLEKTGTKWFYAIREEYLSKKHWHNEYEFLYCMRGTCQVHFNDQELTIGEGETLIIAPGVIHNYPETSLDKRILIIRIAEGFLDGLSQGTKSYYETFLNDVTHIRRSSLIRRLVGHNILTLDQEADMTIEISLVGKILEFLGILSRHPELILAKYPVRRTEYSETLSSMTQYIQQHLHEKITLEDLSLYLGFSPSYCSKYIKRKSGMNFLEYVNIERIEKAKVLLRSSDVSVTEIAFEVGFSSIQSFNRVFKNYASMSPSEYKRSLVKNLSEA